MIRNGKVLCIFLFSVMLIMSFTVVNAATSNNCKITIKVDDVSHGYPIGMKQEEDGSFVKYVKKGGDISIFFKADSKYKLKRVTVDNKETRLFFYNESSIIDASEAAEYEHYEDINDGGFSLVNITKDLDVHVEFEPINQKRTHKITINPGKNGKIIQIGSNKTIKGSVKVTEGSNAKFRIIPDNGYALRSVVVDGKVFNYEYDLNSFEEYGICLFKVIEDREVFVEFEKIKNPIIIKVKVNNGVGALNEYKYDDDFKRKVTNGYNLRINFKPDKSNSYDYVLSEIKVNGELQEIYDESELTLFNVEEDTKVEIKYNKVKKLSLKIERSNGIVTIDGKEYKENVTLKYSSGSKVNITYKPKSSKYTLSKITVYESNKKVYEGKELNELEITANTKIKFEFKKS